MERTGPVDIATYDGLQLAVGQRQVSTALSGAAVISTNDSSSSPPSRLRLTIVMYNFGKL